MPRTPSYTLTCDPGRRHAAARRPRSAPIVASAPVGDARAGAGAASTCGRAVLGALDPDGHGDGRRRHAELRRRCRCAAGRSAPRSRSTAKPRRAATPPRSPAAAAILLLRRGSGTARRADAVGRRSTRCLDAGLRGAARSCRARWEIAQPRRSTRPSYVAAEAVEALPGSARSAARPPSAARGARRCAAGAASPSGAGGTMRVRFVQKRPLRGRQASRRTCGTSPSGRCRGRTTSPPRFASSRRPGRRRRSSGAESTHGRRRRCARLAPVARLPVKKTYKLYIGGTFPRSESGRTYEAEGQNVARASRKDLRDAVVAARAAQRSGRARPRTTAARCSTASPR